MSKDSGPVKGRAGGLLPLPEGKWSGLKENIRNRKEGIAVFILIITIAVLMFRLEPDESFAQILERGHLGGTGETIAFNRQGVLISESRFNKQLNQIGLLRGNHSALNIALRDPGVDMLQGQKPSLSRDMQPLTRMALSATAGEDGSDLEGYRDYRGVPVVGAWLWDDDLGFGLVTEITIEEAFASFHDTRIIVLTLSALSISTLGVLFLVFQHGRKAITKREERYSKSLKYANMGTWELNIQTGARLWSEIIAPLYGYREGLAETSTENFNKAVHPDDRQKVTDAVQSCINNGTDYNIEYRVVWQDGSVHWLREQGDVERQPDGTPIRMLGVVIDIDERKKAAEKLADYAKELNFQKYALDQHAIVSITNVQGRLIYVNDKFCKISGYSKEELLNNDHRIIKSDEHSIRFFEDMWRTIARGKVWQGEIKNSRKDGRHYWVMSTIVPFLNEKGKPFQYVSIRTDITERKEAEMSAITANQAKSNLLANMSHELRTPLNAIIGFSNMMKLEIFGPLGSEKYTEYLDDINHSGQHLLALIVDILDVSAIESGTVHLDKEEVNLPSLIDASVRMIKTRAKEGGVAVFSSVDSRIPPMHIDARRMKQVLLNLLSNAVKFTPENGQVFITALLNDDDSIVVSVRDTGIGMNENEIRIALSAFGQVDSGLNRKHEGAGLGLPLTKGLVELHGGSLDIVSEKNKGTIVNVTFAKDHVCQSVN